MRLHLLLALVACTALPAFAPAPFPRRERDRTRMDLDAFQGTWQVVAHHSSNGGQFQPSAWSITHIRVAKDRWTLLAGPRENATYRIEINPTTKPSLIDWRGERGEALWLGLIRRNGDNVEVLYHTATSRPVSFDRPPAGAYLITLRRPNDTGN
jgi:uncharacterized protein (TIGR03067 family)